MSVSADTVKIITLGSFSISADGKPAAGEWPDETVKMLFCSLLSPLNLSFTWDRISRSMWGVPITPASRQRLETVCLRSLGSFLTRELGFNPLIAGDEGLRIDYQRIRVDAFEFHRSALEGLRLFSLGSHAAAFDEFSRAESLYGGSYLKGIPGRIAENTRNGLDSLYQTAVINTMPLTRNSQVAESNRMTALGQYLMVARRQSQALACFHNDTA
jgi:hypothetical protein